VPDQIWADVGPVWREAFELAWEAFAAGSPPIGAVVLGPDGSVVARGRSRRAEQRAPHNQLAGSRLAHAEVNALAQLGEHEHAGYELYVTMEPCFLCAAAIAIARVPRVAFAGEDPMWRFVTDLGDLHPVLAERWYTSVGPMTGPLAAWATLLPIVERLSRRPDGPRLDAYRSTVPNLVDLAEDLVANGRAESLARLSLDDALRHLWADLV
jgi:tRNA(Arg) A34 adenosine deaminase TadA